CWGLAICCALMVLAKGLIGLVFPGAVIFLYLLLTKNLRHLLRMKLASSTLIFLAIAAPWHILAAHANPPAGKAKGFLCFISSMSTSGVISAHVIPRITTPSPCGFS